MSKNKILLTGGSGFLGGYILNALSGYHITTVGRRTLASDEHIRSDLGSDTLILRRSYDRVIHAAGLAHVAADNILKNNKAFEAINVNGTRTILNALEGSEKFPDAIVYISSVAVYGREEGEDIEEDEPLLAEDPYGLSKRMAEDLIINWSVKHNVKSTIFRLPLVAGKNPPGNLGAMVHAINRGYYFIIGGGSARRSIVAAEDVADIIIKASSIGGIYNLTSNYNPTSKEIAEIISRRLNKKVKSMPCRIASIFSLIGSGIESLTGIKAPLNKNRFRKLTSTLTFSSEHARRSIGWMPQDVSSVLGKMVE